MERTIRAPFTERQQELLHRHQTEGRFHPYTCGTEECGGILLPLTNWVCPRCSYTQDWAINPELMDWVGEDGATRDAGEQ